MWLSESWNNAWALCASSHPQAAPEGLICLVETGNSSCELLEILRLNQLVSWPPEPGADRLQTSTLPKSEDSVHKTGRHATRSLRGHRVLGWVPAVLCRLCWVRTETGLWANRPKRPLYTNRYFTNRVLNRTLSPVATQSALSQVCSFLLML